LTYLVVGGNGFMGTHLVDRLLESGHSVRIYGRSPNRFRTVPRRAEYVEGELGNYGLIREAIEGMEVVYHLACTTLPKTSNDDPIYDVRSNLIDTIQLLEACVEVGVRRVVFASSVGVYGLPETLPIDEDHPTNPISSYAISKLAIEKYLGLFHYLYGLDYIALRISNPYGPYQNPTGQQGVVSIFLHRLYMGQPLMVWGDGNTLRDYLYISDLVDALERAAEVEPRERVLNIGSGHGISINELLELIAEVVGEQPTVKYLPARALDIPASVLDIRRAKANLGWSPHTELAEGVARTWSWVRTLPKSEVEAYSVKTQTSGGGGIP
jgi:UDP-glucose 4-epimerase